MINPPPAPSSRTGGLNRAWLTVEITIVALLVAAGARSAPGVFLKPMEADTGFSLTTLSAAVSVGLLLFGLGAPLSGYLMDRHGPRRVASLGLLLVAASFLASAFIHTEGQLYVLWGVLSGLGTGLAGSVLGAAVAARWFQARRGLVTGVFGAATSAGQLMFIPLLTLASNGQDWRVASAAIGLGALILAPVFWALLRDRPAEVGLGMDGERLNPSAPPRQAPAAGRNGHAPRPELQGFLAAQRHLLRVWCDQQRHHRHALHLVLQ